MTAARVARPLAVGSRSDKKPLRIDAAEMGYAALVASCGFATWLQAARPPELPVTLFGFAMVALGRFDEGIELPLIAKRQLGDQHREFG